MNSQHSCSWKYACRCPKSLILVLAPTTLWVSTTSPDCYIGICSQNSQLSVCAQLVFSAACHGPYLLNLEVLPRTPLTTRSLLCSTSQAPHSCRCCGPWWPEPETLCPSGNRVATLSCTWHSTSIYPRSQNDLECSHLHVQVFLEIPKPANIKPPTQATIKPPTQEITKYWENITPPKNHSELPVHDNKAMETYELPNKELKIIGLRELLENRDK